MADGRIRVDYDNALAQAKKLEEAKKLCAEQVNTIRGIVSTLEECWQGNSGAAMSEKFAEWMERQVMQEARLELEAKRIKKVVEELKRRDEEAAAMIKQD